MMFHSDNGSPAAKMAEERALHDAKLQKMEAEMKMVFQQKVNEKEAKLKQSEEELYARHREMKDALEKQRRDLDDKSELSILPHMLGGLLSISIKHVLSNFTEVRLETGRPLTPPLSKNKKGFLRN